MRHLIFIAMALSLSACSTAPKGFELPPALSETFRNGQLKGLEQADSADLGMPNPYDRTSRVCVSRPIYNIDGFYVRTDVRCW